MASINKVTLIGNVGRDPELKKTKNGTSICNLSLATSRKYKGADGSIKDETEWHRVSLFARQAEIAAQYLKKGDSAYIEGRIHTREYQDETGAKRYATEIIAENLQLLGGRSDRQEARPAPARPAARPAVDSLDDDPPF